MYLQNVVFPKIGINTVTKLYFRCIEGKYNLENSTQQLELKAGTIISFDTYFNIFMADRWKKYTDLSQLKLYLKGIGKGILRIYRRSSFNGEELLLQKNFDLDKDENDCTDIINMPDNLYGLIYFSIEAISDCQIYSGYYYTEQETKHEPTLGIVITTFKREKYVARNMATFEKYLFPFIDDEKLHVYLIDNARSLKPFTNDRITVIGNENYGGAGGFGRGLYENYVNKSYNYTVFCDDDAVYEPESFLRLWSFLSYVKSDALCVGGSMLKLDDPIYIYESGAVYANGYGRPNKYMLDATEKKSIEKFNVIESSTYHAWWFFAFPTKFITEVGMPIPIFFRGDDMEYGMRLSEKGIETAELNGICVWHESFARKSSTATSYYWIRNELVLRCIHQKKFTYLSYVKWFTKQVLLSLYMYRYDNVKMMIRGLEDGLKGPKYLMHINPPILHQKLLKEQVEKAVDVPQNAVSLYKYDKPVRDDWLKKMVMILTFNGMLLPSFLRNHGRDINDKAYVIEPLQSYRYAAVFRKETVLFVDIERMKGFFAYRSDKKFWLALLKLCKIWGTSYFKFNKCKKEYKKQFTEMTSIPFWQKYLNLK